MLSFVKVVLIIAIYHVNGERAVSMREFNSMDECKKAAEAVMQEMAKIPEIENGFSMCTSRVKLLVDDNGKETAIES
jgi:hypothetical protein